MTYRQTSAIADLAVEYDRVDRELRDLQSQLDRIAERARAVVPEDATITGSVRSRAPGRTYNIGKLVHSGFGNLLTRDNLRGMSADLLTLAREGHEERPRLVRVVGPNLRDQSRGSFHVHSPGCADLQRDPNLRGADGWTIEATRRTDVAEAVYEDIIAEDPGSTAADYLDDFHFAPCVADLV